MKWREEIETVLAEAEGLSGTRLSSLRSKFKAYRTYGHARSCHC